MEPRKGGPVGGSGLVLWVLSLGFTSISLALYQQDAGGHALGAVVAKKAPNWKTQRREPNTARET